MSKYTGYVKFYNTEKGYGFIKRDGDGQEVFFHHSELVGWPMDRKPQGSQTSGDRVEFEIGSTPKGDAAKGVSLMEEGADMSDMGSDMDMDMDDEDDMDAE